MQIDIQALETYNELARDGAEAAAQSLAQMTGIETHVEVTNVSLMTSSDLAYEFVGREFVGVRFGLDGALSGDTVLAFDERGRKAITEVLAPGDEAMAKSSIQEVGNIMTSGFIDGWANYLGETIDLTPPSYVEGTGASILPDSARESDEQVFVFRSKVEAVPEEVDFRMCLVPEREPLARAMAPRHDEGISFEKLEVFNDMTKRGAETAAQNVTEMTGLGTNVEVNRLSFVPIEDVPAEIGDDRFVGTVMRFSGKPSGYLAILFDKPSARSAVDALVPTETDGTWGEMEQSAIKELGNIMTSGFIDGWANVLQTSIDHSPPQFVADMGSSIVSPIVSEMARTQEHAFLLDSMIDTVDDGVFRCELFALPDEDELTEVLSELLVERADQTTADPDEVF